jgi:glutathione S-transferase
MTLPVLYSFRRCPYAIRTRLALLYAKQRVVLREVVLRDKPQHMLEISPKGTVPVLQLHDGSVLEESRDIMVWALARYDPQQLMPTGSTLETTQSLIDNNDGEFKHWLDRYKYSDRYPDYSREYYRDGAQQFLAALEERLSGSAYLFGETPSLADIATMPFVRQFAHVDKDWFDSAPYPALQAWLTDWLASPVFLQVMKKYSPWSVGSKAIVFGDNQCKPLG